MRKLRLNLEALAVESFAAGGVDQDAGTVHAHNHSRNHDTCQASCIPEATCGDSCIYTCACKPTYPELTCLYPCVPPPP